MPDLVDLSAMSDADRLAWMKADGAPVKPEGYDEMAADHPGKVSYDTSKAQWDIDVAAWEAAVANGGHPAPSE